MKANVHPQYMDCKISCACGNVFHTRATVPELRLDICSACHPFYTGKQKIVDAEGRVERFIQKYKRARKRPAATTRKKTV